MKRKIIIYISMCLCIAFIITMGNISEFTGDKSEKIECVYAAGTDSLGTSDIQEKIEEASEDKKKLEGEKKEMEKDLKEIEEKKDNIIYYIESLDNKLNNLSQKISQNRKDIKKTKRTIHSLRVAEKKAEDNKINQYDTMKKRIKYMYENGNADYVKLIFQSKSISDMLNRAEYVNKVTSYDKKMLSEYQSTCEEIEETKKAVEINLGLLQGYKKALVYKKKSVNVLIKRKASELSEYKKIIGKSQSAIDEYNEQIEEKEKELENLLEKQRQEIARKEEEKRKKSSKPSVSKVPEGSQSGNYCWPLTSSGRITSYFGYRNAPTEGASTYHKGIDIAVPTGTGVLSVQSGSVISATYSASAGNFVSVYHGNGVYSYYMHCSSLLVSAGDSVSKGQEIALSGSTGISTGPHLHFAMFMGGEYVNPLNYISQ